jgi:hypothetical protein
MRLVTTIAYGFAAALVFVALAATLIGKPAPGASPHGGLTTATILRSDGSEADAPASPAPVETDRPSS